jgi:hypothetical protein
MSHIMTASGARVIRPIHLPETRQVRTLDVQMFAHPVRFGILCLSGQLLGNAITRTARIWLPRSQLRNSPTASIPTANNRLPFGPYVCATNTTADTR